MINIARFCRETGEKRLQSSISSHIMVEEGTGVIYYIVITHDLH